MKPFDAIFQLPLTRHPHLITFEARRSH
uniref:Uncharacterized protein n=1 Tax=Rhizophora mucronata TaxID=61149 RepID=A0A2P2M466_RHIMU